MYIQYIEQYVKFARLPVIKVRQSYGNFSEEISSNKCQFNPALIFILTEVFSGGTLYPRANDHKDEVSAYFSLPKEFFKSY
jgi:hypothetical protein